MELRERLELLAKIPTVFTPGAPIDRVALFSGRTRQLQDVLNVVQLKGQHGVIYGERGVGKTSLANIIPDALGQAGQETLCRIVNCDSADDFSSLWKKIFRQLQVVVSAGKIGFSGGSSEEVVSLAELVRQKSFRPDDIRQTLSAFSLPIVIVIDELDRVQRKERLTGLLADTIKTLSDHATNTTLILVGVADSVTDLIAEHRSIERALVQIQMPRMSIAELREILAKGLSTLGMTIETDASARVCNLSAGLPHYTHLLGLYASQEAVTRQSRNVSMDCVREAIKTAVQKAQQSIMSDYMKAITSSRRETLFPEVVLACALAEKNELGFFAAADVRGPLSAVTGDSYDIPAFARHLNEFCEERRGPILEKVGHPRRFRFRFTNPMMQPYVVMQGLAKGLLTEKTLAQFERT